MSSFLTPESVSTIANAVIAIVGVIITAVFTATQKVAKERYNVEIDKKLSDGLHDAIERMAKGAIASYGEEYVKNNLSVVAKDISAQLDVTNPQAGQRFGLLGVSNDKALMLVINALATLLKK